MTLKELRKLKGLTLKDASVSLGCHYSALSKIERGEYKITKYFRNKLLKFYGVENYDEVKTPQELLEESKKENCKLRLENERLRSKLERIRKALE